VPTLERHLLARLLGVFPAVFGGLLGLFVVAASLRLLREEELTLGQVAGVLPWVGPVLLPYLLPLALAVTIALVYGRWVAERALVASDALGVARWTLVRPALVLGVALSVGSLVLSASVVPACHAERRAAARAAVAALLASGSGEHLARRVGRGDLGVYVRRRGPDGLEGIVVTLPDPETGRPVQLVARRGRLAAAAEGPPALRLEGVTATLGAPAGRAPVRVHLRRCALPLGGGAAPPKAKALGNASLRAIAAGAPDPTGRTTPLEAGLELSERAALALGPALVAPLVVALVFALGRRGPLLGLALGLAAAGALHLGGVGLGLALGEAVGLAWAPALGVAGPLVGAAALARPGGLA